MKLGGTGWRFMPRESVYMYSKARKGGGVMNYL